MIIRFALQSARYAIGASVMTLAMAGAASAQSVDSLAQADTNGDGNITWQEMMDLRESMFGRLDRDGNGVVSSSDGPRMGPGKSRFDQAFASLRAADANGDGQITRSEMLNAPAPMFENGDTNNDRVLSSSELTALRQQSPRQR